MRRRLLLIVTLLALPVLAFLGVRTSEGARLSEATIDHAHEAPLPKATAQPALRALSVPVIAEPTLLASYWVNQAVGQSVQPIITGLRYQPWTSAGRGLLSIPLDISGATFKLTDWLTLTLNRAAQLTIPGPRLPWMTDWKQAPAGFSKVFPAGVAQLGPPSGRVYSVQLAEADGSPSPVPDVPAGQVAPVAGQRCPAWVHDQYQATGPDGISYRTWHPQIDPVYWCTFGHDHGTRPPAGFQPVYGYTASRHGMTEPHVGFKTNTIQTAADTYWVITQHFGTSGLGRACTQFHTVDVAYLQGGDLKADLHFMGDFGKGQTIALQVTRDITGCPVDQSKITSGGARKLHLLDNKGYEAWRLDDSALNIGLDLRDTTFYTGDALTACASTACTSLIPRPVANYGVDHRVSLEPGLKLSGTGGTSGVFYSDPLGRTLVSQDTPGATQQYIEPGLAVTDTSPHRTCWTADAWGGPLHCGGSILNPNKAIENGIDLTSN